MEVLQNYIDGELRPPVGERYLDNFEPATGRVYSKIPASDRIDVDMAIEAAQKAMPIWQAMDQDRRARFLEAIADEIERDGDDLAKWESRDNGKPISLARTVDIPRSASNLRFFASCARTFGSESHSGVANVVNFTRRDPLGVVGCISPWNLPLYLFT